MSANVDLTDPTAVERAADELMDEARTQRDEAAKIKLLVKEKLEAADRLVSESVAKERLANALAQHLRFLRGEYLVEPLDVPPDDADNDDDGSAVSRVVSLLNEAGGPMTIAELHARMPQVKRKTVGWSAWKAAQDEDARSLGRGVYAPLSYVTTDITELSENPEEDP